MNHPSSSKLLRAEVSNVRNNFNYSVTVFAVGFLYKHVNEENYAEYDKQPFIRDAGKKLNLKRVIRITDYLYRV